MKRKNPLRRWRVAHDKSQEELAEMLGVAVSSVRLWETGRQPPSERNLFKLAEFLDVSVDDLSIQMGRE